MFVPSRYCQHYLGGSDRYDNIDVKNIKNVIIDNSIAFKDVLQDIK